MMRNDPEKENFRDWFNSALQLPVNSAKTELAKRGYGLEKALRWLMDSEGLEPRVSYRPRGEQIDGSFFLSWRIYLLEARWRTKPISGSELSAFKGKVDGKLIGTVGLYISMSGYAKDAADTIAKGKTINVLMFDRDDTIACMNNSIGFVRVLRYKLRAAAEEGLPYMPFSTTVITPRGITEKYPES